MRRTLRQRSCAAGLAVGLCVAACTSEKSNDPPGSTGGNAPSSGGLIGNPAGGTTGGAPPASAGSGGTTAPTGGASAKGGTTSGGTTGGSAPSAGGMTSGGATGGVAPIGGAPAGGSGGSLAGAGSGGAGAPSSGGWKCPSGMTGRPTLSGLTSQRIASVPPRDDFNMNNGNFGNVEGPVWIDDALYVSEMSFKSYDGLGSEVKQSRILKLDGDAVSVFIADSGSNGLAVDGDGNLVAAVHKDGSLTRFAMPDKAPTTIVDEYMSNRFNSPNDLAIRSDGNIYFSDPTFQAPSGPPQSMTRVYRVAPGGAVTPVGDNLSNPNGVTLSLDEAWLYVAAQSGRRYPVMADGSLGAGQDFSASSGGDGMVVDCAGNLYIAMSNAQTVKVVDASGMPVGNITVPDIQAVTNVAFGGADHKTLFITGLGNNKGLFRVTLDIPGRPY